MSTKLKFNPITAKLDLVENIPQLNSDPASPKPEDAWVLKSATGYIADGTPIGLLLALTYVGNFGINPTYQLSYRTKESTTVRFPDNNNPFYFGDPSTDGSWRFITSGSNLAVQRRESGVWVEKSAFTP